MKFLLIVQIHGTINYKSIFFFLNSGSNTHLLVSRNAGITNLLTWSLKRKLVEPMEYIDPWFMEQGVRHTECSVSFDLLEVLTF